MPRYTPGYRLMDFGWGCGYVSLPFGHPWYGVHYDNIPVYIHGGLTWSEYQGDRWVIGFDTSHCWDTLREWPRRRVAGESRRLLSAAYSAKKKIDPSGVFTLNQKFMRNAIGILFVIAQYGFMLNALRYLYIGEFLGCVAAVSLWYLCGKEAEDWLD